MNSVAIERTWCTMSGGIERKNVHCCSKDFDVVHKLWHTTKHNFMSFARNEVAKKSLKWTFMKSWHRSQYFTMLVSISISINYAYHIRWMKVIWIMGHESKCSIKGKHTCESEFFGDYCKILSIRRLLKHFSARLRVNPAMLNQFFALFGTIERSEMWLPTYQMSSSAQKLIFSK